MCDAVDEPQQLIHLEQQHVLRSHRSSAFIFVSVGTSGHKQWHNTNMSIAHLGNIINQSSFRNKNPQKKRELINKLTNGE